MHLNAGFDWRLVHFFIVFYCSGNGLRESEYYVNITRIKEELTCIEIAELENVVGCHAGAKMMF